MISKIAFLPDHEFSRNKRQFFDPESIATQNDNEESLIILNNSLLKEANPESFKLLEEKLADFMTMFRSYFMDTLDNCSECYLRKNAGSILTGSAHNQVNEVSDAVHKIFTLARISGRKLSLEDYEFITQVEHQIKLQDVFYKSKWRVLDRNKFLNALFDF